MTKCKLSLPVLAVLIKQKLRLNYEERYFVEIAQKLLLGRVRWGAQTAFVLRILERHHITFRNKGRIHKTLQFLSTMDASGK